MTDESEVIAGLSPEQVVERAKSLQLEVEYWRQVLTDCEKVNRGVLDATTAILDSTTSALALVLGGTEATLPFAEAIVAANRQALEAIKVVGDAVDGTVSIADGRAKALEQVGDALKRAAGIDTHPTDER